MAGARRENRSLCPLNVSLEIFGDRWTLLIVRDLMLKGRNTFREFLKGGENIASNVLADRLTRLEAHGIIECVPNAKDARSHLYHLTEKGIQLAPVLLEMIIWAARHEETAAPPSEVRRMTKERDTYLVEIRENWKAR
ncbi:winged helix-turn-helix transcriptional regulator [Bradyrhizobium liaoningense]